MTRARVPEQPHPSRTLRAPVAVRMVDIDRPADLVLARAGQGYRSLLVVATADRVPVGAISLAVEHVDHVSGERLRSLLERHGWTRRAPSPPVAAVPSVSVVVATCAQPDSVTATVASVLACDPSPIEVVVVENRPASSEVDGALTERFGSEAPIRYVEEQRVGLASARNAGLRVARGEVVAFTDDDVHVDPGWVGAIAGAFASEADAACVTGLILPGDLMTREQVLLEQFAGFGKGYERRVDRLSAPTSPLFPFAAGQFGSGANTAVRADVARSLGGFDSALGTGTIARGGEDLDMYIRILLGGHALVYEPAAMLWHRHPDSARALRRRLFDYGVGLSAMLTKYAVSGYGTALLSRSRAAADYLRGPGTLKNARKGADYRLVYDWTERAGMALGPVAYLVSRRRQRRAGCASSGALTVGYRPAWVGELDLVGPPAALRAPPNSDGAAYERAWLLVRDRAVPVGFVEVPLSAGSAGAELVREALERQLPAAAGRRPSPRVDRGDPACASVIVCTRDRPQSLSRTLNSILRMELSPSEVLVVDNAPRTTATRELVDGLDDARVRYVLEPIAGLSRARNRGVAEAAGEIVAFTDDDVVVDAGWLRALLCAFRQPAPVACVTGLVLPARLDTVAQAYFEATVKWSDRLTAAVFDLDGHRGDDRLFPYRAGEFGAGANFAARRTALVELAGFDEALGAGTPTGGGEDLDFFARVILAGHSLAYEPAAIVWHWHRSELEALRHQMASYRTGLAAYAFKHMLTRTGARVIAGAALSGRRRSAQVRPPRSLTPPIRGMLRAEIAGLARGPTAYLRGRMIRGRAKIAL